MKSSLMLRDPDLTFDSLHQELNNLLRDTFFDTDIFAPSQLRKISTWRPAIEVKQTEKEYKIKVQLPGVNKEDIHIDLENDFMTVTAEIKEEKETNKKDKTEPVKIHTCEFRYGKFMRTISFENPIKTNDASAEFKDGILTITAPKQKMEKTHTKRLQIK